MSTLESAIEAVAEVLHRARRIAILSGAGASAESGVPTFRASDGLWEGHHIEDVASPDGFRRNPQLVWEFYNTRRANVARVMPNPGHVALAELQALKPDGVTVITQNVDGLHQKAGSQGVLELHGSLYRTRCNGCGEIKDRGLAALGAMPKCPSCSHLLRPDIVWFGEVLPTTIWNDAQYAVMNCDVLLVVGTSSVVYPAAGLVQLARIGGAARKETATIAEFNLSETAASDSCDIHVFGPSGQTLPKVIERMRQMV